MYDQAQPPQGTGLRVGSRDYGRLNARNGVLPSPADVVKLAFWNKSHNGRNESIACSMCYAEAQHGGTTREPRPNGTEQNTTHGTQHKKHNTFMKQHLGL